MVPKRVSDRLTRSATKFKTVLKVAKDRDVNESDTVSIITDMLAEIFGYDKYLEVTREFAIRGTFCDLAIKIDGTVEFLIEAKAIGLDLKDNHLNQAVNYGANNGIPWVILTNGINWRAYKIRFEKPINYDLVCEFNFADLNPKDDEHLEKLFIICKEGLAKDAREEYLEKIEIVNRFILGAIVLGDEVINIIRRELRKLSDGILVSPEEIKKVLATEIIKRDVIEGEDATKAQSRIKRYQNKTARKSKEGSANGAAGDSKPQETPPESFSDSLLKQDEP
jgi:predicted type IV restriction endonuclease